MMSKNKRRFFKVEIGGNEDTGSGGSDIEDEVEELIEEEINTDRDDTAQKA
jgi:hypothetical protein